MKKLLFLAISAISLAAQALPTYEPFTEFAPAIAANPTNLVTFTPLGVALGTNAIGGITNCIDLATGGFTAPGGELWNSLNFSGTAGTGTNALRGIDIAVISNASIFTSAGLGSILPSSFPGFPNPGEGITNIVENPAQPIIWGTTNFAASPNIVGNSALLKFATPVTRPTNGLKTLYFSYLISVVQQGQLGTGNDGRYLTFLSSSNLVEGPGSGGAWTNWLSMFNVFSTAATNIVHYFGHGLLSSNSTTYLIGACNSSGGKDFATSPFSSSFNQPNFVVGSYTMTSAGGVKDTNTIWVNPTVSSFGGPTPPTTPIQNDVMPFNMTDIGGLLLEDRIGSGASGGVGTNYFANLIIGSTWSYVTGGPEFTAQPVGLNTTLGATVMLTASAVAAAQNVTYQWQKITAGVTNNLNDGSGSAGGAATVTGSGSSTLTLSGVSSGDLGIFQVVATASGTSFSLASSNALVSVDPFVTLQPLPVVTNFGAVVTFTASASTAHSSLNYAWFKGSTMLTDGLQADGTTVFGSQGSVAGSSLSSTLTLSNVSYQDIGIYSLFVTNNFDNGSFSVPATLGVIDPYIASQPTNQTLPASSVASFTVVAQGSPTVNYQWSGTNGFLSDGPTGTGSTISGSQTATLTISGISDADDGKYFATVSGSGSLQSTNSTSATLLVEDPVALVSSPISRTERVGDHLAFVVSATGGGLTYQWAVNGTNIPGATASALVLTNIQTGSNGTYSVTVSNVASFSSASATLNVINSTVLPVASSNVVVVRVGDGAQAASGATGNTIYLDQYTTNGTYVSTIQVPDESVGGAYGAGSASSVPNSPALLAQGAGADAANSMILTLSGSSQQYLSFAGYCANYPFTGADVTVGGGAFWRGLATISAFGIYNLAYTNTGLYSGGSHTIRGTVTLDGTNFWVTGQAGSGGGVKFINTTVASYANGAGIPTIGSSAAGDRVPQIVGTNLVFSDINTLGGSGLYVCAGTPEPTSGTSPSTLLLPEGGVPNDFAFSPDMLTVYIADSEEFQGTNSSAGGIQRWDSNGSGGWNYSYTLALVTGGTNGAQGMTVMFPTNITTWGLGVTGAVIYATTYGTVTNSLVQIVDNGPASPPTVIATAGPNQALHGVRFGPAAIPVAIAVQPKSQTNFPANSVTFTVTATGSQPFFYQWEFNGNPIPGATQSSFTTNNLTFASAGDYLVVVSNLIPSTATSSNATLTVTAGAPTLAFGVQSFVEGAGDHMAFAPVVNGSTPLSAQWYFNSTNNPIPGATNLNLVLTNIQTSQSGTYLFSVSNIFGTNGASGTLTVTPAQTPLSSNNIVVARVGDGVQALSGVTGNTIYLDQYTTSGTYVSSIQVPDEGAGQPYGTGGTSSSNLPPGSQALLVAGGNNPDNDAALEGLLTLSADGQSLNFAGYCEAYPFLGSDVSVGATSGPNWRGVGSINAFGFYSLVYTNTGLYSGGNHQIHSAVTSDQTNFWIAGEAGSVGVKYVNAGPAGAGYANGNGIPAIGGTDAGTRHLQIIGGNIIFTDSGNPGAVPPVPAGIYELGGLPQAAETASLFMAETNSPLDFAISPDNATVYIADNGTFGGTNAVAGGIQRWDTDTINGGYKLGYTFGTGTGFTAGARGLTVDFSAQTTWGSGVLGAKLYATTAESSGNRLIKIVDNGPASAVTTFATAGPSNALAGVRFGPSAVAVSIASQPQNTVAVAGTGARFSVGVSGSTPYFYQWQFNGTNLPGATQSTLVVSPAQAALPGNYTVVVSNELPSSATSTPASISFIPVLGFNATGAGWSQNGTGGSGLPVYNYNGVSNMVELTQGVAGQASSTFYQSPLYVGGFLATWTYQVINPSGTLADGTAFVIQNDPRGPSALGGAGGSFGYGAANPITNSVALEFNLYPSVATGTGIAVDINGAIGPNASISPVVLGSGDPINVTLQYVNGLANLTLVDAITSDTFTTNTSINIPAVVGGNQAFVGFTAGDGAVVSTQTVSNFVFTSLIALSPGSTVTNGGGGSSLVFTWPAGVGAYVLQQNADLTTPNWQNATNTVSTVNGQNEVTVPVTGAQMFYRLVVP